MDNTLTNVVQQTTDYDQFSLLGANREQARGHIEALKRAFQDSGNFTKVQPILVNDRMQIIDGQHRFTACKELGEPIYYTVVPGLTVSDARSMNILHRRWTSDDYAKSYALTDPNYRKYLQLREQYGFSHTITIVFIKGSEAKNTFKEFREGEFVIEDEASARRRLEHLEAVNEITPMAKKDKFARALMTLMRSPEYDPSRMLKKLSLGADTLKEFAGAQDNMRQLEELYNWKQKEGDRVRLF